MSREVTEDDVRMPEFKGVALSDLEIRDDGKVVRKDRWERAVRSIAAMVGLDARSGFEIPDVVDAIRRKVGGNRDFDAALDLAMINYDGSIRQFFTQMMVALWTEGEGFNPKRPLGDRAWDLSVLHTLVSEGHWEGTIDDHGGLTSVDDEPAARIFIKNMLVYMMGEDKC